MDEVCFEEDERMDAIVDEPRSPDQLPSDPAKLI